MCTRVCELIYFLESSVHIFPNVPSMLHHNLRNYLVGVSHRVHNFVGYPRIQANMIKWAETLWSGRDHGTPRQPNNRWDTRAACICVAADKNPKCGLHGHGTYSLTWYTCTWHLRLQQLWTELVIHQNTNTLQRCYPAFFHQSMIPK